MQTPLTPTPARRGFFGQAFDEVIVTSFLGEVARSGPTMLRVASLLGFLSFFGMAFVDPLLVDGPDLERALALRIATCALLAIIFALTFLREWTRRNTRWLSHLTCIITGLTVIGLTLFTGGGHSDYHGALFVTLFGYAILPLPWRRFDAPVLFSLLLVAHVVLIVAFERTGSLGAFFTQIALITIATVISIVLQQILARGRLREFVHRGELARANERLTALDEAKSRFFANLSHELRTPLTLTLAPLEALSESTRTPLTDGQREKVLLAHRNALRLLRLVDDLLALTRAEAAALRLDVALLDLGLLVRGLAGDIAELAARKRISVDTEIEPGPTIEGDAHLVERVLLNLVGNAAKFVAEGGHITMRVRASRDAQGAEGVELAVADDGIGISDKDLPRIFDRFYQADSGSTRRTGGTGIGLALVREIVELHGGHVTAESRPSVGTTIRCWFPLRLPPERAALATRAATTAPGAAAPALGLPEWHEAIRRDRRYRLQGIDDATERRVAPRPKPHGPAPTLLVVEDNHDMIRFLVALLAYDFNVVTAQNGRDGLRLANERRPDLIISDIMMPEMDGIEMVRELRASPTTRHVPFIFLTARGEVGDRLAGRQGGADIYLTKPFRSEELLAAVDSLLARQTSLMSEMASREDELLVFMASGLAERLAPALESVASAREVVGRHGAGLAASRFELALDRMTGLAHTLEQLARAGATPVARPADIDAVVKNLVDTAAREEPLDGGRALTADLQARCRVALEDHEARAVIEPLVARALRVTPCGQACAITSAASPTDVTIRVEDGGPTLTAPHMERLFFPFYQPGREDPDGLALARARRVVVARGGRVTVEGRGTIGTTVIVRLPRAPADDPGAPT
ncbi:MAG: response regulator [Deltaproteobacteria bacterium]|nr:response regulator [Deltaproteobacteria bacterium]